MTRASTGTHVLRGNGTLRDASAVRQDPSRHVKQQYIIVSYGPHLVPWAPLYKEHQGECYDDGRMAREPLFFSAHVGAPF